MASLGGFSFLLSEDMMVVFNCKRIFKCSTSRVMVVYSGGASCILANSHLSICCCFSRRGKGGKSHFRKRVLGVAFSL